VARTWTPCASTPTCREVAALLTAAALLTPVAARAAPLTFDGCDALDPADIQARVELERGGPLPEDIEVSLTCMERSVRVTIRQGELDAFTRELPTPALEGRDLSRYMGVTVAECVQEWDALEAMRRARREAAPPPDDPAEDPPPAPPARRPWSTMLELYALGASGTSSSVPLGGGVQWLHRLGRGGGYGVDVQLSSERAGASLGTYTRRAASLGFGYLYPVDLGQWSLSARLGARVGLVTYEGEPARKEVEARPFSLPWASPALALAGRWRGWRGLHLGLGFEAGWSLLSASADLGAGERAAGAGPWAQATLNAGWRW
jgi:hypothetical protein